MPEGTDDPDVEPLEDDVALDGGVSLLIAAGVTYASKKYYDFRKAKEKRSTVES